MKKTFTIVLAILCVLCVFSFCGCEKTANNTESETGIKTIIGYIDECHDGALSFDEIEWVNVPSERATELGITDDKAPNVFTSTMKTLSPQNTTSRIIAEFVFWIGLIIFSKAN